MALHLRAALLLTVFPLSLTEEKVNLTAVVGSSITFPDPLKQRGYFSFGSKLVALVYNGVNETEDNNYTNRLHWSKSTGLFTLSNLQKTDSGVYTIDSKKGNVFVKNYELKLFDPVSVPEVSGVNVSSDSCTLQCSVNPTEQITLSWFRGDQTVDSSRTSTVLILNVKRRDYSDQYKCVALNPADKKTVIVNVTIVCKLNEILPDTAPKRSSGWTFLLPLIVFGVALVVYVSVLHVKTERKRKREAMASSAGV
ncbi:hypothetical protein WMY93_006251 [Mugilogobius chulae]|uniref:Ig-like domain-containing protein n=1 Tax=Mugilogobius chulae TaxID=88201 RepID=A0AAW0PLY8_9GOBI